jgi:hypothetical protein
MFISGYYDQVINLGSRNVVLWLMETSLIGHDHLLAFRLCNI